ncbi:MAG TPA: hypothetical protein VIA81_11835 [Acidimicrobiia bacterium]|jgi:hypothetical protein
MKQLTPLRTSERLEAEASALPLRSDRRRRFLGLLRPESTGIPIDVAEWEIVAELDPGMVDWVGLAR